MTDRDSPGLDSQPTHWSLVEAVAAGNRDALEQFLDRYLDVFRHYLTCSIRCEPDVIDDLLQQFLQVKLLEQNIVSRVERGSGFRQFIYQSLKNFVRDYFRSERRRTSKQIRLDDEPCEHLAAEQVDHDTFDVAWADHLLREVLQRVRRECLEKKQPGVWSIFEARLLRPLRDGLPPLPYEELRRQFRFKSPVQAANALETAKRKMRVHLHELITEYVGGDARSIQSELVELRKTLAAAKPRRLTANAEISTGHSGLDESVLSSQDASLRLTRVLNLSQLDSPLWLPDEAEEILRDELNCSIESACDDDKFLTAFREHTLAAGNLPRTLLELFSMAEPPRWLLELVKKWSKSLLRMANPPLPQEVAYVLHVSCICSGLRAGMRSITRSSNADIRNNLDSILAFLWIGPDLRQLLEVAKTHLPTD